MKYAAIRRFREIREHKKAVRVYESSVTKMNDCIFFLILEDIERRLVVLCPTGKEKPFLEFASEQTGRFESEGRGFTYMVCSCDHQNASALRKVFTFTNPKPLGLAPAIGMGDRIGLATPGHIRAAKDSQVSPVLAQQSIREMNRTLRTPAEVLDDVSWAVFQEGYQGGFAADADHLKTLDDIDATFGAGFTMYTIDPSDYVDNKADTYNHKALQEKFKGLPWEELRCTQKDLFDIYLRREAKIALARQGQVIDFSEDSLLRAAVKYSAAIAHTVKMHSHLKELFGEEKFDLEMSVDETETPTSPQEHLFIVSELERLGVRISGLALRFVGRFEKAIDYSGNLCEFGESLRKHVLIAKLCGPYKLSIHSGSDKFSIYPIAGRLASDMIHLKTAGTSYLEALRIVARHDPALFREIVRYSIRSFEKDRRSYHVSTNLSLVPDPDEVPDKSLEKVFLNNNNERQLLHIAYGSILTAKRSNEKWLFRERIRRTLVENEEEHYETVAEHMRRHMEMIWGSRKGNKPLA